MYKRLRRVAILGCIAILMAAYIRENVILQASTSENPNILESDIVGRGSIVVNVSASGQMRPVGDFPLAFAAAGPVAEVLVREGDYVRAGQALARLDDRQPRIALQNARLALEQQQAAYDALIAPPREIDLRAAEAALASAQAQLDAARIGADPSQVRIAELQVELAKNGLWQTQLQRDLTVSQAEGQAALSQAYVDQIWQLPEALRDAILGALNRLPDLSTSQFGLSPAGANDQVQSSEYNIDIARSQLGQVQRQGGNPASIGTAELAITQAQAALDRLRNGPDEHELVAAQAQLDAAQAAVELAEYNLSRTILTAPAGGVVAQINLVVGESAPSDRPAVLLLDDSRYVLDVPVDEADIAQVEAGQPVAVSLDALPDVAVSGVVEQVADVATELGGVVSYVVRVNVARGGLNVRPGLTATATITVDAIDDTLRVRNRFVRLDRRTGLATVTVRTPDGALHERNVTLGLRNETYSQVAGGLNEGDTVVVLPRDDELF
jgi:RND family efflux transporter MFP subunit